MVNKVDGNNYYVYTNQKKIDIPDTGEKFSLSYQNNESPPEAKDNKKVLDQEKQQTERGGVMLELSGRGRDAGADRQKQMETAKAQGERESKQVPLLETIRTYVMAAITAVREFFYKIWNDQPQEDVSQDVRLLEGISQDLSSEEDGLQGALSESSQDVLQEPVEIIDDSDGVSAPAMEEERWNREIQQSLRDGDMDQVIKLLTENGKRTVAKNSTLLTSYDKNGRVVEPNASDRERALHGDKNTWKL
ncbi:MAG: hypothetical protein HDQ99_08230 [Lachnospiraceae bacterium]|nr:hypothetical protein [Lachnospiraceae bacterium]